MTSLLSIYAALFRQARARVERRSSKIKDSATSSTVDLSIWPWPSDIVLVIILGITVGAQALIIIAHLLQKTWVDPPFFTSLLPYTRGLSLGDERDQTLYHAGLAITALTGIGAVLVDRSVRETWDVQFGKYRRLVLMGASAAVVLGGILIQGVLPTVIPKSAPLFTRLGTAVGFLAFSLGAIAVMHALSIRMHRPHSDRVPIPASIPTVAPMRASQSSVSTIPVIQSVVLHGLIVILIFILQYIPDMSGLVGLMQEQDLVPMHHWDFFAMAPGHAYLLGLTPVLDAYSQYGVGIPIIMANLSRLVGGFSYVNVIGLAITLAIPYYAGVYALLWVWTRSYFWSASGVIWSILLQTYSGLSPGTSIWTFPSSTFLRSPLDICYFLVLTWHARSRRQSLLIVLAFIVGASIFWETDTGLYLAVSYLAYAGFNCISSFSRRHEPWRTVLNYAGALALVPADRKSVVRERV